MNTFSWSEDKKRYKIAFALAILVLSTFLGVEDESLALFGISAVSFIVAISGRGIALMITRIQ